jgi:predicted molibdopterin-dependent oxidoreductase YjgC
VGANIFSFSLKYLFISLQLDGRALSSPQNFTVFQLCVINRVSLPCFCYHERLTIAGNCRICLVSINNALSASCAISSVDDMEIFTDNLRVRLARESVLGVHIKFNENAVILVTKNVAPIANRVYGPILLEMCLR